MPDFDQAQSPRLGQRTPVEATFVRMFTGVTIPEAAWTGQMIYRTDRHVLQVYTDAGAWEDVLGGVGNMLTFVGPSIPVSLNVGDVWYDTDDHYKLYISRAIGADAITAGEWELAQDSYTATQNAAAAQSTANTAVSNAATAQTTANSKIKSFIQGTVPTSVSIGDVWYDSSNGFKPYRAAVAGATTIGVGAWVAVQDGAIATAQGSATAAGAAASAAAGAATTAQSTADSKNTVYYAGSAPTGGTYKINDIWFNTALDWQVSQWSGSAWVPFSFGTTAITDGAISTEKIQVGAIVAEHIDVGAITADKLSSVLALVTTLQVGDNLFIDGDGITIFNPDPTKQPTIIGSDGNVFIQGTATLDQVQINNNLTLLGLNNVINGGVKLGTGFAEPTKKPSVTQYFKNVSLNSGGAGFNRWGFWEKDSTTWASTDQLLGASSIQLWAKAGNFGATAFSIPNMLTTGGVVWDGSAYYVLGTDSTDSGNWRIRRYSSTGTLLNSWRTSGFSPSFNMALGWDFTNSWLLVFRVGTGGIATLERWNINGTSAGANVSLGTWDVLPAGIVFTSGTTLFGADRYVAASKSNGTRVFNTSGTRQTSEEFTVFSTNMRGQYYDGTRMWGYNGAYSSQHAIEPGGSKDFALTWVDNDTAGSGTAISNLGPRNSFALARFKWTGVTSPAPPDDGTTDGANTAAIYVGAVAGTMYQQTVFATSPSVGGSPTTLTVEYDKNLTSTSTPHPGTSGFAGRPSTAPGSVYSETLVPSTSNPMLYLGGNGQYRMNGTNLDDVAWTALTGSAVGGFGVQYRVKNGMVSIQVDGTISVANNTIVNMASGAMPTALRPASVSVRGGAYFSGQPGVIFVQTNGIVAGIQQSGGTTTTCGGTLTYPVP